MQELRIRKAELSDLDSIMNIEENGFIPEIQEERQVFEARIKACPELFLIFGAANCSGTANSGEAANTNGAQNSSDTANTNNATTNFTPSPAGYLCAELMSRIPETAQDVALGHTPEGTAAVEDECTPLETPAQPLTAAQLSVTAVQPLTAVSHLAATAQPLSAAQLSATAVQPLTAAQPSILYISSFSLLPQFRGNGNGTKAWNLAMSYFEKHFPHISAYVLLVNKDWPGAAHIYTKSGFKEYKVFKDFFPRQDNSRSDGILMIKTISPENLHKPQTKI